jgi:predicted ArsR family transcriptional regulator
VLVSEATRNLLEGEHLGELDLVEVEPRQIGKRGRPLAVYELIVPGINDMTAPPSMPVSEVDR